MTHFTDFVGIVMSTWRYLPNARMWKIKATRACLANGIHYKNTGRHANTEKRQADDRVAQHTKTHKEGVIHLRLRCLDHQSGKPKTL